VGGTGWAPPIHSAKVIRSGTSQSSPLRTQSTGLSSTRRAQAAAGSGPAVSAGDGGAVRAGSDRIQHAHREDFQPVRRPCNRGEFANAASSTGPNACTAAQRRAMSTPSPGSTHTCTAAVELIALRP
jgi:hypothetical protein